ncbi:Acidic leucine-rich nuclear phosphoprotein 32 like protein, partial [Aduncisulcus paluster]
LRILSASGCGLSAVGDILDLTPIVDNALVLDTYTPFKLTSLDLSNNSISDVSVLITSSMFPDDTDAVLTTLDISGNSICDIEGIVSQLQIKFPTLSTLTYSDQTCHCSASVSSAAHQVCREVYPDRWAVECWNGHYLDKSTRECVEATDSSDIIRCQVCEGHSNMMPVLEVGASSITCGCRSAWYGDDCDQLYSVHIPDKLFRGKVCDAISNSDPLCDVTEFEMAGISGIFNSYSSHITSFEGTQYLINISNFRGDNTDVTSVYPISFLEQLPILYFYQYSTAYNVNIYDFNSLFTLNRFYGLYIYGNEQIYDISVSFRNVGLSEMYIAHTNFSAFIPLCRSEDDNDYWTFITTVFPIHESTNKDLFFIPNSCSLNNDDDYVCDSGTYPTQCPSIVLNEVYNSVADPPVKECAFIAKKSGSVDDNNLTCYTVHDDNIRAYLSNPSNGCLSSSDIEDNGMISVATLRSSLACSSLNLSDIVSIQTLSSVNSITTLQGLEYTQGGTDSSDNPIGLTSLNIDGYDLSGDTNPNVEYDKLVVQILSKGVKDSNYYGSINSGLISLSASGCGLSVVNDVLDLTPIASGAMYEGGQFDPTTRNFKLTSLDLSNNSISDVSVLITSSMFPGDTDAVLTTLDISDNNICDIEGIVSQLQTEFPTLSTLTYSDQTCHCSAPVSSSDHQVCREVYPDRWAVECWNGYYLDKASGECLEVCASGSELDTSSGTPPYSCTTAASDVDDSICLQVCERHTNMMAVLEAGDSSITCGCRSGWYGEDCSSECPIVGGEVCSGHGSCNTTDHVCECDTWYGDASCSTLVPIYSAECDRTFIIDDHLECNEVYPGRYAAECEDGYYYDQGEYSCFYDTNTDCPSDMNDNQMCVKTADGDVITSDCRSAWYGDDCDQLYSVHIPDTLFRGKVCDYAGYDITVDPLCDVSEFEMAGINGKFYSSGSHIKSFEGAQYLINIYFFSGRDTDVTSVYPIPLLEQLSVLYFHQESTTYNGNIYDLNSLFTFNRLYGLAIYGNEQIYDISVSFRNVGLSMMYIAYTPNSGFIPLCRSEDDNDYWTFITTVFPIHSSTVKDNAFIPNSCALNNVDDYVCDSGTYPTKCPSIVLNEVYNSVADPPVKECAFIAKSSDGKCYTVHDDYIRQYLVANCLSGGTNDLDSGIISVATMRSVLSCPLDANSNESLSLPDIASAASLSSVNSITTLQGLEYATSLTSLTLDGYDLSGDINSNAEYDKLVVQILAKAVTYPPIDSGLRILSVSGCGLSAISDVLDLTPIASGDSTTDQFKLTSLDLSNNSISDVSVLITSSMFPDDTDAVLTTLDI